MDDNQILTALERQPLTVENIAYGLGLPLDETREIILRLWHEGYIDTTTSVSSSRTISAIVGIIIVGGLIGGQIGAVIGAATGAVLGDLIVIHRKSKKKEFLLIRRLTLY